MNTKNRYIQPTVEKIEMEVEGSIMTGSDVNISNDDISTGDGPLRSRKNFWNGSDE